MAKGKTIKVTLSEDAAKCLDFLVQSENVRYSSIMVERLIMQAVKKLKKEDRPPFMRESE